MINFEGFREYEKVNEGLINLGFTVYEAIMESIDDSIDANSNEIEVLLGEKDIIRNINNENIVSNRIEYIIIDNGDGIENLIEVFDFGRKKEHIYMNREDYKSKNGIYHYGAISHINVGTEVIIYSKTYNGQWKGIKMIYDEYTQKTEISKERKLGNDEVSELMKLCKKEEDIKKGSIVHVKGVSRKYIGREERRSPNRESKIKVMTNKISQKISLTYKWYLENKEEFNIKVNNKNITAQDIFLEGAELPERLRTTDKFTCYQITLKELLEELNDEVLKESLLGLFNFLGDEETILDEKIAIELYALSEKWKDTDKTDKDEYERNGYLVPNIENSGLYIRRNNRYIGGHPFKVENVIFNHNDFNNLRGELRFSPVFDKIFGIQINKNRCEITESLENIIEHKVYNDKKLKGKTCRSRLVNAIKGEFSSNAIQNNNVQGVFTRGTKNRVIEVRKKLKEFSSTIEIQYVSKEFINEINNVISELRTDNISKFNEKDILFLLANVNRKKEILERKYKQLEGDFIKDYKIFMKRVEQLKAAKVLQLIDGESEGYEPLHGEIEPQNEAEMFSLLNKFKNIYKNINGKSFFDFHIKDYDYINGIDCLIEVEDDLYNELDMENRFNGITEDITNIRSIINENLNIFETTNERKYAFLEMKMEIPINKMNHSMRFVTHLLCWERNDSITMRTDNVEYEIDSTGNWLMYDNKKRVKVLYLKEVIEDTVGGKFREVN